MKKNIALLILVTMLLVPVSAEETELNPEGWWNSLWHGASFCYDVYARSTMLRGDYNIGGGFSGGVETDLFRFEGYIQGDYFLEPMGSKKIAALEFDVEAGISLGWKFLEFWHFTTYVACDLGYNMQFLQSHDNDSIFMFNNGFMVRPKLMTELKIFNHYSLSLGVYYQFMVYPYYDDYKGLGILFSIA